MRCAITKPRTLRKLSARLGRPVIKAVTRGDTGHRIDVKDADGVWWQLWPDGTIDRSELWNAPTAPPSSSDTDRKDQEQ